MKKIYQQPALTIVRVKAQNLLINSAEMNNSDSYRINSSDGFGSRRRGGNFYDDEDDDW